MDFLRVKCAVGLNLGKSGERGGGGNAGVIGYVAPRITRSKAGSETCSTLLGCPGRYTVVVEVVLSDVTKAVTRRLPTVELLVLPETPSISWSSHWYRVRGVRAHNALICQLGGDRSPGVRVVWRASFLLLIGVWLTLIIMNFVLVRRGNRIAHSDARSQPHRQQSRQQKNANAF